jgi:hypothetical protein
MSWKESLDLHKTELVLNTVTFSALLSGLCIVGVRDQLGVLKDIAINMEFCHVAVPSSAHFSRTKAS